MELLGLIVTILLALLGYFVAYFNNLRLARRADKLKYVTTQIDELYGPLYVITQTGEILFQALRAKGLRKNKNKAPAKSKAPVRVSARATSEWRIWIEQVFQPLNEQLEQIIINKAHLIIEEEMPHCLKRFLAHSAGYKAVIKKWQMNDYSESASVIDYPGELIEYAVTSYQYLKSQQKELIEGR